MKKEIGVVGVDSGQIIICDPCNIDDMWKHEEFQDERRYKHNDGTILQYRRNFEKFDSVIPKYGKDMNALIADKEVTKLPPPRATNEFSYNGVCEKTLGDNDNGQIHYPMGHEGLAVVSGTGYGDGVYPVIADISDKSGRVKSITIVFIDDVDDDDI